MDTDLTQRFHQTLGLVFILSLCWACAPPDAGGLSPDAATEAAEGPTHSPDLAPALADHLAPSRDHLVGTDTLAPQGLVPRTPTDSGLPFMQGTEPRVPSTTGHVMAATALDDAQLNAALGRVGSALISRSPYTDKARLALPEGANPTAFSNWLLSQGLAVEAHPDPICTGADDSQVPQAPMLDLQWHHEVTDTVGLWNENNAPTHGGGPVIAILDTGIAYEDHSDATGTYRLAPDLARVRFHQGYDFINQDEHPNDDHRHGTFIATLISGLGGTLGVAYGADLMPVKVLDDQKRGTESALVDGIYYAVEHGADVINMSLAFPRQYQPGQDLQDAVAAARNAGVVLVAATGNNAQDTVAYPAAFPGVIAVGASTIDGDQNDPAPYSNHGPALDMLAPGGDLSRDTDSDGYPDGILSQTFAPGEPTRFGYWFMAGTSFAAPQVAAAAALLIREGARGADVREILMQKTGAVRGVSRDVFHPEAGKGVVDLTRSVGQIEDCEVAIDARDGRPEYGINTVLVLTETPEGERRSAAIFEVIDGDYQPANNIVVHAAWLGVEGHGSCETNNEGRCVLVSPMSEQGQVFGVRAHKLTKNKNIHRPVSFARIELLSYRLSASLAGGLSAGEVAFSYDDDALSALEGLLGSEADPITDLVLPTVTIKRLGVDSEDTPIVLAVDPAHFHRSPISDRYLLLSTFGTGLASSALVWDQDFFNPSLMEGFNTTDAIVWSFAQGTDQAERSIWAFDRLRPLDFWNRNFDPAIVYFNGGVGLGASSIVLDRGLWNPALFEGMPEIDEPFLGHGVGLASSAFIFDFDAAVVDWLGFDPESFDYNGGVGLGASSFVFDGAPDLSARTLIEMTPRQYLFAFEEVQGMGLGELPYEP